MDKIDQRSIENAEKCSICFNSISISFFCYEPIGEHNNMYAHRDCLICRAQITNIIKTFLLLYIILP